MIKQIVRPKRIFLNYQIEDQQLLFVELSFQQSVQVSQAIVQILDAFNKLCSEKRTGFNLDNKPQLCSLRLAKKSGKPKTDLPQIDKQQYISNINFGAFSLCPQASCIIKQGIKVSPQIEKQIEIEPEPQKKKQKTTSDKQKKKFCCF